MLGLPLWAAEGISVVLGDVLVYWVHRACHHYDILWRFHALHHGVERLDWLAAHREHPLDGVLTQLCSNVRFPLGFFPLLLGAPELHRFHHARVDRTQHDFANLAPWLDCLFRTYHRPPATE